MTVQLDFFPPSDDLILKQRVEDLRLKISKTQKRLFTIQQSAQKDLELLWNEVEALMNENIHLFEENDDIFACNTN